MGHHLLERTDGGCDFQSDKHPGLPKNRLRINLENPRSWRAALVLSEDYAEADPEFAADLRKAVESIKSREQVGEPAKLKEPTEEGDVLLAQLKGLLRWDLLDLCVLHDDAKLKILKAESKITKYLTGKGLYPELKEDQRG